MWGNRSDCCKYISTVVTLMRNAAWWMHTNGRRGRKQGFSDHNEFLSHDDEWSADKDSIDLWSVIFMLNWVQYPVFLDTTCAEALTSCTLYWTTSQLDVLWLEITEIPRHRVQNSFNPEEVQVAPLPAKTKAAEHHQFCESSQKPTILGGAKQNLLQSTWRWEMRSDLGRKLHNTK